MRNSAASCPSSWSTPSISGAATSPVKSRKNRYSHPRPGMGRDSIFSRLSPWTAKMVRISWREPLWWGRRNMALILFRSGRSSSTGDTTTNRVWFMAL